MKQNRKATSISDRILDGLEEAVAFEYGKLPGTRVDRVTLTARVAEAPPAPTYTSARIARIRSQLRLSQAVFAMALNVSAETVRAWEQGKREPDGAALRLLQIAEQHPEWILETVSIRSRVSSTADG
ncbi:MAG TPA: helix-turn-helix domain-containing protein [Gemmatimonadaceae bacterium]